MTAHLSVSEVETVGLSSVLRSWKDSGPKIMGYNGSVVRILLDYLQAFF